MGKLMLNNISYTGGSGGTNVVPNPPETATDDLTSIKIDNTVYNLAGGDVADVEVNGESVLDANHIAQIKSYKTLTQAEYDALPSSKLTDDVLYCITDAGIVEEQQFAPVIYSLEERQIGTWIDGKPLYQKTFMFDQLTNIPSNNWFDTGFTLNNCLICGEATAFYMDSSTGSSYAITASIDVGINQPIYLLNYRSAIITTHGFTIQYTKTTDIPGSGDWTTSGVPTVHIEDGIEQIIGTYNGETLYRKRYKFTNPSAGDQMHPFDITGNIKEIVNFYGVWHRDMTSAGNELWAYQINAENEIGVQDQFRVLARPRKENGVEGIYTYYPTSGAYSGAVADICITIEYTKVSS